MDLIIASLFIVILLYFYLTRNVNYWAKRGVKGPKPLPFFGNLLDTFKTPCNILEVERFNKYGRIFGYFEFSQPILTVGEPELLRQIMVKDFNTFVNHTNLLPGDPLFSKMIGNLQDDDWRRVRAIVSPTFTSAKVRRMQPYIEECIRNTMSILDEIVDAGEELNVRKLFASLTIDVIARCAFATKLNSYKDPKNEFLVNCDEFLNFTSLRHFVVHLIPHKIQKMFGIQAVPESVLDWLKRAATRIFNDRKNSDEKHNDFIQMLMDAEIKDEDFESSGVSRTKYQKWRKKLDESEIIASMSIFLLAGYETTASLIFYCVYSLALHQDVQERLREELKQYIDSVGEPDYDSLNQLVYLEAVINETLRLYTPVVQFDRVAGADYPLGDTGIVIPKGTTINLPFYAIHHDPEFFDDPFEFRPERFLPENKDQIKPNTFLPFGIGPRMCLAMRFALFEAKLTLLNLLTRFVLKKSKNTTVPPKYNSKKILLQCEPILLRVERRNNGDKEIV